MVWILAAEHRMTTMDESTLVGLVAKRAEIAEQIEITQAALRQLIINIENIEATIRLFDPNGYQGEITRNVVSPPPHRALPGDTARTLFDVLRSAPGPMTTRALTLHVMGERGLDVANKTLVQIFLRRVGASLRHYRDQGSLRSVSSAGARQFVLWEIAI
jgi:hypothetical protein